MDEPKAFISESQKWRPTKKLQLVAAIVLVALILVGGIWFGISRKTQDNKFNAAMKVASADENNGNFVGVLEKAQSVVVDAHNKQQKDQLYSLLAISSANLGDTAQAIQYYQQKHEIDPSTEAADSMTLGTLYQQNGEKKQAIAQYKLAISYIKTHESSQKHGYADVDAESIEASIQSLEGK